MKKMLFLLLAMPLLMACRMEKEDVDDPAEIIINYEIDVHGFMPTGPTIVNGIFEHDSVCESMMMMASEVYTYHYADGHTKVEDHGTFVNYTVDGLGKVYVDSISYASDSMSVFGNGDYIPLGDSLCYTANIVVELNDNKAPIRATCYVAHEGKWATLRWQREENEHSKYWDCPRMLNKK